MLEVGDRQLTCVNRAGFCLNVTQSLSVALSFSTLLRIVLGSSFKSLKYIPDKNTYTHYNGKIITPSSPRRAKMDV